MEYYKTKFREDLVRYCEGRSDVALLGRDSVLRGIAEVPGASQHIRFGTSGWEPEKKHDFYFSLYFTVLTDMALHAHFPSEHAAFDRLALYPKLFGMGVAQRLLPSSVLCHVRFRQSDLPGVQRLWRSYCTDFIQDWQDSLLRVCGVDGFNFLRALLADPDLSTSAKRSELLYAEREDGGCARPDGTGDCRDPSGYLESMLLGLIKDEVRRIERHGVG